MAIKVRRYQVVVGLPQEISVAQGEDCMLSFAFTDPAPPLGTGQPVDYTGMQGAALVAKDRQGEELVGRVGVPVTAWVALTHYSAGDLAANGPDTYRCTGTGTSAASGGPVGHGGAITDGSATWAWVNYSTVLQAGDLTFVLAQSDTASAAVQPYDYDVTVVDAGGLKQQLALASTLRVTLGVEEPGDTITSPVPVPVTYGYIGATFDTGTATGASVALSLPNGGIRGDGTWELKLTVSGRLGADRVLWYLKLLVDVASGIASISSGPEVSGPVPTSGAASWAVAASTNGSDSLVTLDLTGTGAVVWTAYSELRRM